MNRSTSEQLYHEALQHIVGGVNSPSRSFKAVGGGAPVFMKRASGSHFWDEDGNEYIDYLQAYGPIITLTMPTLILPKQLLQQQKMVFFTEPQPSSKSNLLKC